MPESNKKYKVLHLARWYPNRYDPMPGLFIQRHVESTKIYCDASVIYTHMVEKSADSELVYDLDYQIINEVPTAKVYYRSSQIGLKPLDKLINIHRFFKANHVGINQIKKESGKFDIIHIHILTRLGVIGLFHKLFYSTPYIITEHWSRYLNLTGSFTGFFRKFVTRLVVKYASAITAVTNNLADAMRSHRLLNTNYIILPNVVDSVFLSGSAISDSKSEKTTFLHVSCFEDKSKNISGLLRVISELSKKRNDFVFRMVGDGMDMDWLRNYSNELGLNEDVIQYTGLLEGKDLVNEMKNSDILVIFSNYENFPVVINESLSLGVPVIATRVGGIPERINHNNGILVDAGKETQLLKAFEDFLDNKIYFNMEVIQNDAVVEFSPASIGRVLNGIYDKSINQKSS